LAGIDLSPCVKAGKPRETFSYFVIPEPPLSTAAKEMGKRRRGRRV
jgi:hypothetical protein